MRLATVCIESQDGGGVGVSLLWMGTGRLRGPSSDKTALAELIN